MGRPLRNIDLAELELRRRELQHQALMRQVKIIVGCVIFAAAFGALSYAAYAWGQP